MDKLKKYYIFIPIITAILSCGFLIYENSFNNIINKSYIMFINDLESDNVSEIIMDTSSKMKVILRNGEKYLTDNPQSDTFKESILLKDITVKDSDSPPLRQSLPSAVLGISLISILVIVILKYRGGSSSVTSFDMEDFSKNKNAALSFESIAGNEEAKESLMDVVDFLKNPDKYKKYGARMPKGVILYGEPGTGKTLLAKAVAGEADVPFYALSGSDFVQVYVGVGAARVRNLFKKAKSHGKAVIFIDEIDAIGKARSSDNASSSANSERDQTLNALLTEMSGFGQKDGIVVIAATNRLDMLDKALLRPGRFDRHIEVYLPDIDAREKIISLHLKNKPHKDINVRRIAEKTVYFSGAKLENLINESAILAAKDNIEYITEEYVDKAFSIIIAGYEKKERNYLSKEDKMLTSYHECGHGLVSLLLLPKEKISKITIIPTTKGSGGYTLTIPEDTNYHRADYLRNKIKVLLGGRAAEEIIFGREKISTGAQSDLSQSTEIAIKMLCEYGMGETVGLINLPSTGSLYNSYGSSILNECKELIDALYYETIELLKDNRNLLDKLSLKLLEEETLYADEIHSIVK